MTCFSEFYKKIKFFKKVFKKVLTNRKICGKMLITQGQEPKRHKCGSIAQLGEHLPYKQRVIGSSPIVSTMRKLKGHFAKQNESNLTRKCQIKAR